MAPDPNRPHLGPVPCLTPSLAGVTPTCSSDIAADAPPSPREAGVGTEENIVPEP